MKVAVWTTLGLGLFLALGAASVLGWAWLEDRPVEASQAQRFTIPPGEALSTTARRLAEGGLVRNASLFRWLYQWDSGDGAFPSGTFEVPGGLSVRGAVAWFRGAHPLQVRVTLPEGWTATKIARLLEEKEVVSASAFLGVVADPSRLGALGQGLTTLEGRLFPDTYQFPVAASPEAVATTLIQNFVAKTSAWTGLKPEEFAQRLVLASIVEREYRAEEEAPLIASVFANRLQRGIPLGSCATIEYILTEIQGRPHPKRIFFVHTEIPSPFNTYLNKGLPPQPIANPGLTALRAAFEPAQTNYLYFVVADAAKGTHTFSSQYSQHQRAREAYLSTFVTKG